MRRLFWLLRPTSLTLALLVVCSLVVVAAPRDSGLIRYAAADDTAWTETEAVEIAQSTGESVEVESLTGEFVQVMAEPSGGFVAEVSPVPQRVETGSGWQDVDLDLVPVGDGFVKPAVSDVDVAFPVKPDDVVVRVEDDGRWLEVSWPTVLPAATIVGSTAVYAEVLPGVDLVSTASETGFSFNLVVKSAQAAANPALDAIRFGWRGAGLELEASSEASFDVVDAVSGEVVYAGSSMRMWSDVTPAGSGADLSAEAGAGSSSDAGSRVGVTVLPAELILAPDSSFLRADDTSFPVVIDPMLAKSTSYTNWLMVWSDGQKFWNNSSEHARAGFDGWEGDKVARSMYAMDTRFLDGKIVGKATFQHRQIHSPPSHCEPTSPSVPMGIYRVGGINSGQSWSNQPNWYERYATSNVQHGTDRLCPGYTNTEWNVTNGAKQAADNGWDALTLGLRSTDEGDRWGWRRFDNVAGKAPVLIVEYNTAPNTPSTPSLVNGRKSCDKWWTTSRNPTLESTVSDPDRHRVKARFYMNDRFYESGPDFVSSGSKASRKITEGLGDGAYSVYARANDGSAVSAGSSGTLSFTVDTKKPNGPEMTSSASAPRVGERIAVRIDSTSSDVESYLWGVNTDTPSNVARPDKIGWSVDPSVVVNKSGPNWISARAVDCAGNVSDLKKFEFKATLDKPSDVYRLDGTGVDSRGPDTVLPSGGPSLTVPSGTQWEQGRWAVDAFGQPQDPTDRSFVAGSTPLKTAVPFDTNQSFSVSTWVYVDQVPTGASGTGSAVGVVGDRSSAMTLGWDIDSRNPGPAKWAMVLDSDDVPLGRVGVSNPASVVQPGWTHLTGVFDAEADVARVYVNGALVAEAPMTMPPFRADTLQIGAGLSGTDPLTFNGRVDEVIIHRGPVDANTAALLATKERQ